MDCPACAQPSDPGDRFCSQCATPLVAPLQPAAPAPASPSSETGRKGRKRFPVAFFLVFVAFQVGVFAFVFGGDGCSGSVKGQLSAQGAPFGEFTMTPTSCFSGAHESFFGVWVTPDLIEVDGRSGFKGGLKLVKTHTGVWEAYVESPNECRGLKCRIRKLDPDRCEVFEVDVRNTNSTYNDIRVREGGARLKCAAAEGGLLTADLTFSGCH